MNKPFRRNDDPNVVDEKDFDQRSGMLRIESDLTQIYSITAKFRCMNFLDRMHPPSSRLFEAARTAAHLMFGLDLEKMDCCLSQTITPFVCEIQALEELEDKLAEKNKSVERFIDRDDHLKIFTTNTGGWRIAQARSCVIAIVQAEIFKLEKSQDRSFPAHFKEDKETLEMIQHFQGSGMSMPRETRNRIADKEKEIVKAIDEWTAIGSERPKVLSYLVGNLIRNPDDRVNLAALVTKGNETKAQRLCASPIQVLNIEETMELLDIEDKEKLVRGISERRSAAQKSRLTPTNWAKALISERDLWTGELVNKGEGS